MIQIDHNKLKDPSLRADEIKIWLTPSAKQRQNPCSELPAVYPDLSRRFDWPVKRGLCFVCRDHQKTGNSKSTSRNSLRLLFAMGWKVMLAIKNYL